MKASFRMARKRKAAKERLVNEGPDQPIASAMASWRRVSVDAAAELVRSLGQGSIYPSFCTSKSLQFERLTNWRRHDHPIGGLGEIGLFQLPSLSSLLPPPAPRSRTEKHRVGKLAFWARNDLERVGARLLPLLRRNPDRIDTIVGAWHHPGLIALRSLVGDNNLPTRCLWQRRKNDNTNSASQCLLTAVDSDICCLAGACSKTIRTVETRRG
jgi:hypothetical protein